MNRERGFTVVEMMITVAIVGILVAAAAPGYQDWVTTNRLNTYASDFVTTLHFARSEAVKRNASVTLCKTANGTSCTTSGHWQTGWIVFVDGGTTGIIDGTDTVLRVHEALGGGMTLQGDGDLKNYISYRSNAMPVKDGILNMCNLKKTLGRDIKVASLTGKPTVDTDTGTITCKGGK